jgi:ABC-type phosphate transport system substrate-binding protein
MQGQCNASNKIVNVIVSVLPYNEHIVLKGIYMQLRKVMTKFLRPYSRTLVLTSFLLPACSSPVPPEPSTRLQSQNSEESLSPTSSSASVQINGAAATFPLPIYTEWTYAYLYVDPTVAINYQGIGSGDGKKAIIEGTVDFAGSDPLLKAEEYEALCQMSNLEN